MDSTIKNALVGGGVAGGTLPLIVLIALLVLAPVLAVLGWYLSWWSFEVAVIMLLLMAVYTSGGGE